MPWEDGVWLCAQQRVGRLEMTRKIWQAGSGRMITQAMKAFVARVAPVSACGLYLAGCAGNVELGPDAVKGKTVDGTVDMTEVQAAYIGSGSAGTGVLVFRGKEHPFRVGGVGVGGIGLSTIDARGEVYNLLWMQNEAGVILRLKAKREGLILSLGGDAVVISLNP